MRLHDLLHDVEAEPEPIACARRRSPLRNGSKMWGSTSGGITPPLLTVKATPVSRCRRRDIDRPVRDRRAAARCRSGWTRPARAGPRPSRPRGVRRRRSRASRSGDGRLVLLDDALDQRAPGRLVRALSGMPPASRRARQVEHVVDHPAHALARSTACVAGGAADCSSSLRCCSSCAPVTMRVERVAQVVPEHRGEHLVQAQRLGAIAAAAARAAAAGGAARRRRSTLLRRMCGSIGLYRKSTAPALVAPEDARADRARRR